MTRQSTTPWGITVQLADGSIRYFSRSDRHGQSEWSPRISQAQRFTSEGEARVMSESFASGGGSMHYSVVTLPRLPG